MYVRVPRHVVSNRPSLLHCLHCIILSSECGHSSSSSGQYIQPAMPRNWQAAVSDDTTLPHLASSPTYLQRLTVSHPDMQLRCQSRLL